mmetsp:Transcript_3061/g.11675  ORF Transcript_3061/g.11675 Transcript_3061/m.11675 type:complete len:341 (+) Transcript_3061:2076-3098(+)
MLRDAKRVVEGSDVDHGASARDDDRRVGRFQRVLGDARRLRGGRHEPRVVAVVASGVGEHRHGGLVLAVVAQRRAWRRDAVANEGRVVPREHDVAERGRPGVSNRDGAGVIRRLARQQRVLVGRAEARGGGVVDPPPRRVVLALEKGVAFGTGDAENVRQRRAHFGAGVHVQDRHALGPRDGVCDDERLPREVLDARRPRRRVPRVPRGILDQRQPALPDDERRAVRRHAEVVDPDGRSAKVLRREPEVHRGAGVLLVARRHDDRLAVLDRARGRCRRCFGGCGHGLLRRGHRRRRRRLWRQRRRRRRRRVRVYFHDVAHDDDVFGKRSHQHRRRLDRTG